MLENNYPEYKLLKHWVLKPIAKDLNTYSNMKVVIDKRGRPTNTLIFQVELADKINLIPELANGSAPTLEKINRTPIPAVNTTPDNRMHSGIVKALQQASTAQIQLTSFEVNFLSDMQSKYNLNNSFAWLTQKQRTTLDNILAKYGCN